MPAKTDDSVDLSAADVVALLQLRPHPEGGFFHQTFCDTRETDGRAASTAIYFLLTAGERSAWHRVDAAEVWHFYSGAPLRLMLCADGREVTHHRLGRDLRSGERPQLIVPAGSWQAAESLGGWTLVGCTVAPGFTYAGFELAPPGWQPVNHTR